MLLRMTVFLVLLSLVTQPAALAANDCPPIVGMLPQGPSQAVAAYGTLFFLGRGPVLTIVDPSQPTDLRIIGEITLPNTIRGIAFQHTFHGTFAMVATGKGGLRIIDISNPPNPVEIAAFTEIEEVMSVATTRTLAFLTGSSKTSGENIFIIDTSNPTSPELVGGYDPDGYAFVLDVAVKGDFAFVAHNENGLLILDVSNPAEPLFHAEVSTLPGYARSIEISNNFAYVASSGEGLRIFDISNPAEPILVGLKSFSAVSHHLTVFEKTVYVTLGLLGCNSFDVTDPANPVFLARVIPPGYCYQAAARDGQLGTASYEGGMHLYDVTIPQSPFELGNIETPGRTSDLAAFGNFLMAIDYDHQRLRIIDITDPSLPTESLTVDIEGRLSQIMVVDQHAYLTSSIGVQIFDISDPLAPTRLGVMTNGNPQLLRMPVVLGEYAFTPWGEGVGSALLISTDISDPHSPVEISRLGFTCGLADYLYAVGRDHYVYLGCGQRTLVFDVDDPKHIIQLGFSDSSDNIYSSALGVDNHLAIANQNLEIIDISDPYDPFQVGTLETAGASVGVSIHGRTALVADYGEGLLVVDISDPAAPNPVCSYETPAKTGSIDVDGRYIYVSLASGGLAIFEHWDGAIFADSFESSDTSSWAGSWSR